METLIETFLEFLQIEAASGCVSGYTLRSYLSAIKQWFLWCDFKGIDPVSTTKKHVLLFRKHLLDKGLSPGTVYNRIVVVRRWYDSLNWSEIRPDNPARGIKAPRLKRHPEDRIKAMTLTQLNQVVASLPPTLQGLKEKVIIALCGGHGLRACEMRRAKVSDLHTDKQRLLVDGKTGERYVNITAPTLAAIQRYLAARQAAGIVSDYLVCAHHGPFKGNKLARGSLEQHVNRIFKRAGVAYSGVHCLRHTAASLAIQAGARIEHVRDLLGHANISTTNIYVAAMDKKDNNPARLIALDL